MGWVGQRRDAFRRVCSSFCGVNHCLRIVCVKCVFADLACVRGGDGNCGDVPESGDYDNTRLRVYCGLDIVGKVLLSLLERGLCCHPWASFLCRGLLVPQFSCLMLAWGDFYMPAREVLLVPEAISHFQLEIL